jgi:hypothetical protein
MLLMLWMLLGSVEAENLLSAISHGLEIGHLQGVAGLPL